MSFRQLRWELKHRDPQPSWGGGGCAGHGGGLSHSDPPALSLRCLGDTRGLLSLGTTPVHVGMMGSWAMALQSQCHRQRQGEKKSNNVSSFY